MPTPIIECRGISKSYTVKRGGRLFEVAAIADVSLAILPGQTVGLVGESGSGKSTIGRIATFLTAPTTGEVRVDGRPLDGVPRAEQRALRRRLQVIWQDPFSSMNVRDTIETIVTEAPIAHGLFARGERRRRAEAIVESVGLPADVIGKRPNQLSGGQLQRIAIGRALALEPELVVCDEVTSALDVSMQAQILNLLHEVQQRTGVAYLFISHDLNVVRHISDTVAVMYAGRIVEHGSAEAVHGNPQHPYTRELVRVASGDRAGGDAPEIEDTRAPAPDGCAYRTTCPLRQPICDRLRPDLAPSASGAEVACHVVAPAATLAA